jgi:hypothetical protein
MHPLLFCETLSVFPPTSADSRRTTGGMVAIAVGAVRGGNVVRRTWEKSAAKERIRQLTRRNRGIGFDQLLRELNSFLTGWVT